MAYEPCVCMHMHNTKYCILEIASKPCFNKPYNTVPFLVLYTINQQVCINVPVYTTYRMLW